MSNQAEAMIYTQADLDAARRAATRDAREDSRAEVEAADAALDVAASEVSRLRGVVDVARQAVAARDRFGWSPEADAAIGRLRDVVGLR
ncbi:hypothetical protein [Aquabacterium sp. OR-4]|uniref:hypothetical protein n=1 Tax=Aquabacterium sp. OR-4 TaxID=2978127 RepID=UPI0021B3494F|nr:hypothetical protein [Aquabacterium sp. OR-4]MDT7836491.1 hypothetical protein [Aquabacterium sp. OR-4]